MQTLWRRENKCSRDYFIAGGGQEEEANVMTHPFGVEYGDLFSSIDNFVADALAVDEEVAADAPTTF
jgi:hypothetical protein